MENKKLDISKLDENKLVELYIEEQQRMYPDTYFFVDKDSKMRVHLSPWDYFEDGDDDEPIRYTEAKFFRDKKLTDDKILASLRPYQLETGVELFLKGKDYFIQVFFWQDDTIFFRFYLLIVSHEGNYVKKLQDSTQFYYQGEPIERDPDAPKKKRKKKRIL